MKRTGLVTPIVIFLFAITISQTTFSQDTIKIGSVKSIVDSLAGKGWIIMRPQEKTPVIFQKEEAMKYLQSKYLSGDWTNPADPLRAAIGELLYLMVHPPFDTLKSYLGSYKYDSINIPWEKFYKWDTMKVKIPVIFHPDFLVPSDSLSRADTIGLAGGNDSLLLKRKEHLTDSIMAYKPVIKEQTVILRDTIILIARDSSVKVLPYRKGNPFRIYKYPGQGDSLGVAVNTLTDYLTERDSSVINFRGLGGSIIPVWLNSKSERIMRYWLKNDIMDSVTVWIGSMERNTIGLFLEEGIIFRRPVKQTNISDARLNLKEINTSNLHEVNKVYIKPRYWSLKSESNFILNQAMLSNWVKGGESSISTTIDVTGYANYTNKKLELSSNNYGRIKYGLVATSSQGVRKNLDLLETNSKLNHKAFGKVDFSGTVLFKTQMSVGRSYFKLNGRDTSIVASKFMNPAQLTIGLGLDYKPNKTTSINFAPFSYKGTFVPDTANIDQTKYGVPKDKKSLNEPGASIQVTNEFKPYKRITITNRLQLFTNYIHNPLNIDVDWEMIATANLNWFTDVRLNTHLIYDDDTITAVLDKEGSPIMGPDGNPKRTARTQFKELLGFSVVFRF